MKIAIIGGGITGLTSAYELAKQGHLITIFEKEKVLGGLAVGLKAPGWEWSLEKGYHHLFTNDSAIINLLTELGIGDKLIIKRPVTANYWNVQILQFDRPTDLLTYPAFGTIDKLRTGALLAFLKINPFWQPLEGITAKDLLIGLGGKRAWELLWRPLMVGKFGDYAEIVAASWMWARIYKRTPSLAYIEGGFQTLVGALENEIKQHGGVIHVGTSVDRIDLKSTNGKSTNKQKTNHLTFSVGHLAFEKVLLTVPTPVITTLVPELKNSLTESLKIPHLHAQTLILETKEPILDKVYWLSITDPTFPFLAVVAHTNFMDKKHYGGHHLTYFGNYLPTGHKYLSMTKDQLLKEFIPYIRRINPSFHLSDLLICHLFIGFYAQPVHQLHYSKLAPKLETPIPGLYIANLDSIYPWDRGTNYAVELGLSSARMIANSVT